MTLSIGKRIILTGGRGRLAGILRQHFEKLGWQATSLSRCEDCSHRSLESIFEDGLFEGADTLIHLAWSTVPYSSECNIGQEWEVDLPLLVKVLRRIAASPSPERLHFVFLSSGGAVYGNSVNGVPSREGDLCRPIGWYGHAKLAAEAIIGEFGRRCGLHYTIVRASNPYGFNSPASKPQGLIPRILKCAHDGEALSLWGDGSARKDFLFHTDFSAAMVRIVTQRPSGIFNLGYGKSHTLNDVISIVEGALNQKVRTQQMPAFAWDVHDSRIANSRLCETIDWRPDVPLANGINQMLSRM